MSESADNLKSKATLTVLDLLGEGKIGGLVNGNKSVFFNDTQLQNDDGTYNFQGVTSAFTLGENTQSISGNFGNYVETPYNIGVQVKTTTPYTFSVVNPMADAVRVIVNLPGLYETKSDSGDIVGYSVKYKFQMSIDGGPFTDVPMGSQWTGTGTWATVDGKLTATAEENSLAMRASVKATISSSGSTFAYAKFQPQEWNGTAWVNLGAVRTINAYRVLGANNTSSISSETVSIQSNYAKVRFVQLAYPQGGNATLVAGTISTSQTSGDITISGKSRSKYQRKHILSIPRPASTVEVRMVRLSADSNSAYITNDTYLDSYYEIITLNMVYPNSALYGFSIDSEQFNQIPSRSYLVDGLYIKVPTNYDAAARTYSGVWDGTFKLALSNNPAWIMYDLLTNARYGLGGFLGTNQVDKAALYTIGRYCDELVSDGYGGFEPRFTINTVINSRQEAYRVISDIASVFRGMTYWAGGMACFTHDAPTDSSMIYGRANVIGGEFSYTGSARKDRHSVVHVTWNDPNENYKKKIEYVEDPELIATYGVRKFDTLAFGCASRGQAARVGKWILYTEKYESDFITFKVGMDSAFVAPGHVIKIQDPARAGRRVAGRLVSCTTTSATLDAETVIGTNGTISLMLPNGSFVDRAVLQSEGSYSTFTWTVPLSEVPEPNAMWLLQEDELVPVLARVVSVSQSSATEFEITAIEHNPEKYGAIEQGLTLTERKTSIIDSTFIHAPSQVSVTEAQYFSSPGVLATKLLVSWTGDCTTHELVYQGISDTNKSNPIKVMVENALTYEILNVGIGTYQISLTGINPLGKRSATVTVTEDVAGRTAPPSDVAYLDTALTANGVLLTWGSIPDADFKLYEVRKSNEFFEPWESATYVTQTFFPRFEVTEGLNFGSEQWQVKAINTWGVYSANPAYGGHKLNQIGELSNVVVTPGFRQFFVQYDRPDRVDFGGVRVHVSDIPNFAPDSSTLVYDGPDSFVTVAKLHDGSLLAPDTTYHVKISGYSRISTSEMEYSIDYEVTPQTPLQSAPAYLYQWAMSTPTSPDGFSEYDWASGLCLDYTGDYGWSTSIPTNPGTPGIQLWQASRTVLSTDYTVTTSSVDWSTGSSVRAISVNGYTGNDGTSPPLLKLTASGYAFTFNADGSASPSSQTIGFTATLQNMSGTANFVATAYDASNAVVGTLTMGGSGNTRTLTSAQMDTSAYIIVSANLDGQEDTIRVVRLTNGATGATGSNGSAGQNAISGLLTNEAATVAADASGTVSSFSPAGGSFKVWDGITDKTGSAVTYSVQNSNGVTISINASGVYSISAMSADTGSATLRAVYGGVTIDKIYSIAKSKAGTAGVAGASGVQATQVRVYQWAVSLPAGPTGTGVYTWASNSATYTGGGGWQSTPGTSPSAGYTLYAATVDLVDSATVSTTSINWATAVISAVGYAGTNGTNGASAQALDLTSTAQSFTFDGTNTASPASQTVTFTANLKNLTGTATFTCQPYNSSGTALTAVTLGGTGNTRTLTNTQFAAAAYAVVTATLSGFSDTITVVRLRDGATGSTGNTGTAGQNAVVGYLTNEAYTVAADSSGTVGSFSAAGGTFKVFDGLTDKTGVGITYSVVSSSGVTISIASTGVYTVSAMSADTGSATLRAVYGSVTIDKAYSIAKSKAGANGANGTNGTNGSTGAQGASYRTSFARVASNPTPTSGNITTSGSSSYPTGAQSLATWGFTATWAGSDPDPASVNTLYQADGVYDPATGNTVWSTPYIASLKVGTLSAITANTGTLTVTGTLSTANGLFSVDASGNVIVKSATTGARVETKNDVIKVYDSTGALRVQIGNLSA